MRTSGSASGSCKRAASGAAAVSSATAARTHRHAARAKRLLPILDPELRLQLALIVGDRELEVLGADVLLEIQGGATGVIEIVRPLAGEEGYELVLADFEIADVEPLDAALHQRVDLPRGIEIVGDLLAVDLQLHRVEGEERPRVHGDEHGHLGVGRIQQLLLQHEQIAIEIEDVTLQRLYLAVDGAAGALLTRCDRLRDRL